MVRCSPRLILLFALLLCSKGWAGEESKDSWVTQFLRDYGSNLILVKTSEGRGSGFICRYRGQDVLITNTHVVAAMPKAEYIRFQGGKPVVTGAAAAAVDHDVFCLGAPPSANPLQVMEQIESNISIGDEIVILGNTSGFDVALPLHGTLLAIGPNLIEVSAEFQPGNSGSPIIHRKTGKVIGVATLIRYRISKMSSEKETSTAERRFGYRLDTITTWQQVNWDAFRREAAHLNRISSLTNDLIEVVTSLGKGKLASLELQTNPAIQPSAHRLMMTMKNDTLRAPERLIAGQNFVDDMKATCRADVQDAKRSMKFDYFRRKAESEAPIREEMAKALERLSDAIGQMR